MNPSIWPLKRSGRAFHRFISEKLGIGVNTSEKVDWGIPARRGGHEGRKPDIMGVFPRLERDYQGLWREFGLSKPADVSAGDKMGFRLFSLDFALFDKGIMLVI